MEGSAHIPGEPPTIGIDRKNVAQVSVPVEQLKDLFDSVLRCAASPSPQHRQQEQSRETALSELDGRSKRLNGSRQCGTVGCNS